MAIPNARRFRLMHPDGVRSATIVAVLPKGTDVGAYLQDANSRFDWKTWEETQQRQFKVRVGQQKQKKAK
ncbi:MAG: hypothetical protein R2762_04845 [Bryobacteraceae bacterium]